MPYLLTVVVLPLAFVATGIGMALTQDEPMWLLLGAVLGIGASFLARGNSGR